MSTIPASGDYGDRPVDEQFMALVCSDEDLLREAFEEIIAAEWPERVGDADARAAATGWFPISASGRRAGQLMDTVGARLPIGGWGWQRSPPIRPAVRTPGAGSLSGTSTRHDASCGRS